MGPSFHSSPVLLAPVLSLSAASLFRLFFPRLCLCFGSLLGRCRGHPLLLPTCAVCVHRIVLPPTASFPRCYRPSCCCSPLRLLSFTFFVRRVSCLCGCVLCCLCVAVRSLAAVVRLLSPSFCPLSSPSLVVGCLCVSFLVIIFFPVFGSASAVRVLSLVGSS